MSLHTIYDQITLTISTITSNLIVPISYGFSEAMDSIWNADITSVFIVILGAVFIIKNSY